MHVLPDARVLRRWHHAVIHLHAGGGRWRLIGLSLQQDLLLIGCLRNALRTLLHRHLTNTHVTSSKSLKNQKTSRDARNAALWYLIRRHCGILHHHALKLIGHSGLRADQRLVLSLLNSHHALVAGRLSGHDCLETWKQSRRQHISINNSQRQTTSGSETLRTKCKNSFMQH